MSKFKPIIDSHIHSHWSLLDGVSSPAQNVARAKEMGAPSSAITDHGFVSGIYDQYFACKEAGIKPLLGCELFMRESLEDDSKKYYHGIFIAMNKKGLENLIFLSSLGCSGGHWKERRPVVSFQEIFDNSEGLLFSTACVIGILGTNQKKKVGEKKSGGPLYDEHSQPIEEVNKSFLAFKKVFKDRMFVEIGPAQVNHDYDGKTRTFFERPLKECKFGPLTFITNCLQEENNRRAILMARLHDLPIIVASDAHMCHPRLKKIQDLLMTTAPDNFNGFHFYQTHASLDSEETWAEFQKNHPYVTEEMFTKAIDNTHKLNELVEDYTLEFPTLVPKFPMRLLEDPTRVENDTQRGFCRRYEDIYKDGMTSREFMKALIKVGGRLPEKREYYLRLQEEIGVICDNGVTDYTDYFLVLADIVRAAGEIGVGVGAARGSAGGCLLSYLLGITAIDPIQYGLSFVRFLNVGRLKSGHPPDIDSDFTDRDPIADYILKLYGLDHAALVGAFQTIKTKQALKDITRSELGGHLPNDHIIHKICKDIDTAPQYYPSEMAYLDGFIDDDGNEHPGLLVSNKALREFLDANPNIKQQLGEILEKPRHLSKHAGGVVITPGPIDRVIPTQHWQNAKCTQIGFKTLEKIGGLKIDILGVTTLNFIWGAVKLIEKRHGIKLDPWNLPEDLDTFRELTRGHTSTVFQFDTPVVRPFLAKIKPKSLNDLALVTSVARPGCLDSKLEDGRSVADHFVDRWQGTEPVEYLDPILEPILRHTKGLVIYQEQIQKIFEVVGGLTPLESDDARRAVGKKNLKVLLSIKGQLFEGAQMKHKWDTKKCEALWESFIGAANYAWGAAHACAYAITAYACAYLKKHYSLEWWAAVLSNMESDKIRQHLAEIDSFIGLPDVNNAQSEWTIVGDKILPPLTLVAGVGDGAVESIREAAPFTSFVDFWTRINKRKVNKVTFTNLILAGCFASVCGQDSPADILREFYKLRKEILKGEAKAEVDSYDKRKNLIRKRSQLLAVASYNYVEVFADVLKDGHRNGNGATWKYENKQGIHFLDGSPVIEDAGKFPELTLTADKVVVFVGMFCSESKTFYYEDRRTKEKVGAYKLLTENNKQIVEVVLWPKMLAAIDRADFEEGALIAVFGTLAFSEFKKTTELRYMSHKRLA